MCESTTVNYIPLSTTILSKYACMVITYRKGKDQPGKVANPARGQLNKKNDFALSPFAPGNVVLRDGFGSAVPRQPSHISILKLMGLT